MKITLTSLLAFGVVAASALAVQAQAQPAPKIAVVDMDKLYRNHWKTKDQEVKLKGEQQQAQSTFDGMRKDLNTVAAQLKELQDEAQNPISTADAKAKAQSDFQKLYGQFQQKQSDLQQFGQSVQAELQKQIQNFHTLLIDEISQLAIKVAQSHGATILLDKSGVGITATHGVLWSDPSYDITDEVQAQIDKDKPASAPAPAGTIPAIPAAPAPAASATPSSPGSSPITVPGVTPGS